MNSWRVATLGEVCEVLNGGTPRTDNTAYWDGPHAWITPAEMGRRPSPYVGTTERTLSDRGLQNSSARLLPARSVILSTRAPIGHLVINTTPMAFNQGCRGLVPRSDLDYKFLFHYLTSKVDLLNSLGTGATFRELSASKLKSVSIPVPPIAEQKRIVAILDEAFAAIDAATANAQNNLTNARELFESHVTRIFSEQGSRWDEVRLGDICERVTVGHVGPTSPYYRDSGILFLRTGNVTAKGLCLDDVKFISPEFHATIKKSHLQPGDVIMSRVISDSVNCAVIPHGIGPANCANVVAVRPGERVESEYLLNYIRCREAQRHLLGKRVGSAQSVVNTTVVKQWPIRIPDVAKQRDIVEQIETVRASIANAEINYTRKLDLLAELKQSILHQAFTDELTAPSLAEVGHSEVCS